MPFELSELQGQLLPAPDTTASEVKTTSSRNAFLPCFAKVFSDGVPEGRRNQTLFRLAIMLLREGYNSLSWPLLCEANGKCSPPLSETELKTLFESAGKENNGEARYKSFGCQAVMAPLCDQECPLKHKQGKIFITAKNIISFQELEEKIKKWLLIEDPYLIKHLVAVVLANKLPGDPVWTIYKAAPGGAKTELIQGLNGIPEIFPLSEITENTFLSGERSKHDPSLLLSIKSGTIFTYKDFGVVISMHRDKRGQILHQLREIYDGSFKKITGKSGDRAGDNIKKWNGKIGFIAGATTVIEEKHAVYASLGERFLQYHIIPPNRKKVGELVIRQNRGRETEMREEIKAALAGFINGVTIPSNPVLLEDSMVEKIVFLADFVTLARSGIERDTYNTREIQFIPDPELPTRFAKQLSMITSALTLISGELTPEDIKLLVKNALDCLPTKRRLVISELFKVDTIATDEMADLIGYATSPTRYILEDLTALKIVKRDSSGKSHSWSLSPEIRQNLADNSILLKTSGGIEYGLL